MQRTIGSIAGILVTALVIGSGSAERARAQTGPETMTFAGLNASEQEGVSNYYNGGTGSDGSGPGPNYGVSYTDAIIAPYAGPYTTGLPAGSQNVSDNGSGTITMDVAKGFTGALSFLSADYTPGTVTLYSGLDGGGSVLGALTTSPTYGAPPNYLLAYDSYSLDFSGTAESAVFTGQDYYANYTNITITPYVAPPPLPPPPITLTFNELGQDGSDAVDDYYNGGYANEGTTREIGPGPSDGVSFVNAVTTEFSTYLGPYGTGLIVPGGGSPVVMNATSGLLSEISFDYIGQDTTASVYSGLNGTGDLLGTISLLSPYTVGHAVIDFTGVGESLVFGPSQFQFLGAGIDNITYQLATAPAPESSSAAGLSLALGLGGAALLVARRRRSAS